MVDLTDKDFKAAVLKMLKEPRKMWIKQENYE